MVEVQGRRYHATWRDSQGNRYEQDVEADDAASLAEHKEWAVEVTGAELYVVTPLRVVAFHRAETEACEAGTPGCSVWHRHDQHDGCDTW